MDTLRRNIASTALIATLIACASASAGSRPMARAAFSCGGIHAAGLKGSIPVHAYGDVSCSEARSVIHTIYNEAGQNHTFHGWRCVGPSAGGAICRKGSSRITGG
jgi:hypothetical protein